MKIRPKGSAASPLVIENVRQLRKLDMVSVRPREMPLGHILCTPTFFGVEHEINEFMRGNVGKEELLTAIGQWFDLIKVLSFISAVKPLPMVATPGLPDMVFAANAGLTYKEGGGRPTFIPSSMWHWSRDGETRFYTEYMRQLGYDIQLIPDGHVFEGQGDALWHPGKMLLWGGYGQRSTESAYEAISAMLGIPVIALELVSKFYHLDTCFCPLDERTVLYYPGAFTGAGRNMIQQMFARAIVATKKQAETFACNSIVVGENIIMPEGDGAIPFVLEKWGFNVICVDMSEFLKSGGAARCLALDHYV